MGAIASILLSKGLPILASALLSRVLNKDNKIFKSIATKIGLKKSSSEEEVAQKLASMETEDLEVLVDFQYDVALEEEVTKRLESDNKSDSWITNHIRPLSLAFMLITTILYCFCILIFNISENKLETIESIGAWLFTMNGTVFSFYFGGRSLEKIQQIKIPRKENEVDLDEIPKI